RSGGVASFAVTRAALARLASLLGLDAALEALARHRVHAERREELAQEVVGRKVAVLQFVTLGDDFRRHELADGITDHLLLFGPLEHGHKLGGGGSSPRMP